MSFRSISLAELFGGPSALRLLFGPEARVAPVFHFFGKFAHGLFVERTSLTSRQRGFGIIDGREKFRTLPFAFFPLPQGLTHGIFLAAKPATLDGPVEQRLLGRA